MKEAIEDTVRRFITRDLSPAVQALDAVADHAEVESVPGAPRSGRPDASFWSWRELHHSAERCAQ